MAVAMYDDHLEVVNPGSLHFGITPKKLTRPHESKPWNPIIANVFYRAGIIERWGSGTLNIIDWCRENANPKPARHEQAESVYATFMPAALPATQRASRKVGPGAAPGRREVTGGVTGEVAGEVRQLLRVMKSAMSRSEIQRALDLKGQANFRNRYLLPALRIGLIEMTIPDKPNSRMQKYKPTAKGRNLNRQQELPDAADDLRMPSDGLQLRLTGGYRPALRVGCRALRQSFFIDQGPAVCAIAIGLLAADKVLYSSMLRDC